ncbi:MAG: hypothetical protein JXJ30_04610 [Halothiobacillaceae bacterium]|nr:hypothetical protein [Halothiobacillaceae bacterium]
MEQTEIIRERYPHLVDAVFDDSRRARDAASALVTQGGLSDEQVDVVEPNDPRQAAKLEPESSSIFRTVLRSHALLGLAGVVLGLVLAAMLISAGFAFAQTRPGWVYGIFAVVGGSIGMLLAGLVSARPDHEPVIAQTVDAANHGRWTVVVHARDEDEKLRANEVLKAHSEAVRESL